MSFHPMRLDWRALVSFAVSLLLYLVLAGSVSASEVGTGLVVAFAVAGFATVLRANDHRAISLKAPPWRFVGSVSASLITETAQVCAALWLAMTGRSSGESTWLAFEPGGISSDDCGRRAQVVIGLSAAPNGYVIDLRPSALDPAEHGLLVHRLRRGPAITGRYWPA